MSTGFNWFKEYKLIPWNNYYDTYYELVYIGGNSTSHSGGNIIKVQNLLEKYGEITIPYIETYGLDKEYEPRLISPEVMSKVCKEILENSEVDEMDMRDRIEWFKELSDKGYYLTYNYD